MPQKVGRWAQAKVTASAVYGLASGANRADNVGGGVAPKIMQSRAGGSMMVPQQRAYAEVGEYSIVPPVVASAATRYQRLKEIERLHLALMARHDLVREWSPEVREVVLDAREHICEARAARDEFRRQVREFVLALRATREPLSAVLRHTRAMLQLLETS